VAATLEQRRKQRFEFLRCLYELGRGSERVLLYIKQVGDAIGLDESDAEVAARYLAEKRLIRVVMGRIISISQAGADELEAALEQPEQATAHFPAARVISQPFDVAAKPLVSEPSIKPLPAHIVENDSDELAATELQRICDAIGLDPKEITGDLSPHHPMPGIQPFPMPEPEIERGPHAFGVIRGSGALQPHVDHRPALSFSEADLDVILRSLRRQLVKLRLSPDEQAEAQAEIDTACAQLASPKPKPHILAAALETLVSILQNDGPSLTSEIRELLFAMRDFHERLKL
jgi:hypothetical protein